MSKYIYGLDLSISCTGVAVLDIETEECVYIGSIKTNAKEKHGERLHQIREELKQIKKDYPPYIIAIERGFTRFNNATQVLYRVHGVVNELFYNLYQVYYTPKEVKLKIANKGNATKNLVKMAVRNKYNIAIKNDDESDALAVAIVGLKDLKGE